MANILIRFWLHRFATVFFVAIIFLGVVEWLAKRPTGMDWISVVAWSATAAVFSSSLSTWWAWKRQCRMVFKRDTDAE